MKLPEKQPHEKKALLKVVKKALQKAQVFHSKKSWSYRKA